jgi:hypothetical protein
MRVCYRQRLIPEDCSDECSTPALSDGRFLRVQSSAVTTFEIS